MNCPNCNARLSCSCKLRSASNGAQVCTHCINAYELKLVNDKKLENTK